MCERKADVHADRAWIVPEDGQRFLEQWDCLAEAVLVVAHFAQQRQRAAADRCCRHLGEHLVCERPCAGSITGVKVILRSR
jgi:hypothetical protein